MRARNWDLFCRVVDNYGDIGVCWRLAADLGSRSQPVRLWVDDASALAWMAPAGAALVSVRPWCEATAEVEASDVVIEAFGCDPPAGFVNRMASRAAPPWWINLEYLSAEAYALRCHGLRSPQSTGPGAGLDKWFFYPGFSTRTGGLIRETDLLARQHRFKADAWLGALGIEVRPAEVVVSLFCYDAPGLAGWIEAGAQSTERPTLVLATSGSAAQQVDALLGRDRRRGGVRAVSLPRLTQLDYDHLLWASDLNFVRGEDSFVRAQWAARPFVWQIYPQADGAHASKLLAYLDLFLAGAEPRLAADVRSIWLAWNGLAPGPAGLPDRPLLASWRRHCTAWREQLLTQPDLASRLIASVRDSAKISGFSR